MILFSLFCFLSVLSSLRSFASFAISAFQIFSWLRPVGRVELSVAYVLPMGRTPCSRQSSRLEGQAEDQALPDQRKPGNG